MAIVCEVGSRSAADVLVNVVGSRSAADLLVCKVDSRSYVLKRFQKVKGSRLWQDRCGRRRRRPPDTSREGPPPATGLQRWFVRDGTSRRSVSPASEWIRVSSMCQAWGGSVQLLCGRSE